LIERNGSKTTPTPGSTTIAHTDVSLELNGSKTTPEDGLKNNSNENSDSVLISELKTNSALLKFENLL
jgi:hypothetical protein